MKSITSLILILLLSSTLCADAWAAKKKKTTKKEPEKKAERVPASAKSGFSKRIEIQYEKATGGGELVQVVDKENSIVCVGKRKAGAKMSALSCVRAEN
ncbi:MAG: hypothetical protein AABZ55_11600 [Bdellovibrionota bacterium]